MSVQSPAASGGLQLKLELERQRNIRSIRRSICECFTSTKLGRVGRPLTPNGLVHCLGVYTLELELVMARGKAKVAQPGPNGAPKFVDVKLDTEQRAEFVRMTYTDDELVTWLESFVNDGYRVGFSWASEQQAYFVSLTGRETGTVNDGYCMTSFAKDVRTAVALAFFKHTVVTNEQWLTTAEMATGSFG